VGSVGSGIALALTGCLLLFICFSLVLNLVHSFPCPTQVDCYFEHVIVGISAPAVPAVTVGWQSQQPAHWSSYQ